MRFVIFAVLFLTTPLTACHRTSDPDGQLARDFIDAYYVMADQQKALTLSSDRAQEALNKESELVKGVANREEAYKARDITFELKDSQKTEASADYFYELRIIQPELGDMKKLVHIAIDRKTHKVSAFSEVE